MIPDKETNCLVLCSVCNESKHIKYSSKTSTDHLFEGKTHFQIILAREGFGVAYFHIQTSVAFPKHSPTEMKRSWG